MSHSDFKNIQTIIKLTKTTITNKTGEVKTRVQYLIANFKTTAIEFKEKILQHWRVETYHYHLDELTCEDDHIAYIDSYSIAILRSFSRLLLKPFSIFGYMSLRSYFNLKYKSNFNITKI